LEELIMRGLTIGEVARQAGVNLQTIRFYERRGILEEPPRRPSGYREFDPETVRLIRFIKRAQALGFTLREVQELLRLRDDQSASCADVRTTARAKMEDIDRRIESLRAMRKALGVLVDTCRSNASVRKCPILEALEAAGETKRS
jgi:MerR family mercuric resistance operon transcriptional regulator